MRKLWALAVVAVLTAACASLSARWSPSLAWAVEQSFDKAWPAVLAVVQETRLPIKEQNSAAGLVVTKPAAIQGEYAVFEDTGNLNHRPEETKVGLRITVRKTGASSCEISVACAFQRIVLYPSHSQAFPGQSSGKLEAEIREKVVRRLG